MTISLNPHDPLRGIAAPGVDDIARIEKKDAVVRSYPPPPVLPQTAARLNRLYLGATLLLAVVVALLLPSALNATGPWDQQSDIRSVYVMAKYPSHALLIKLAQMADAGIDVRLVSARKVQIPHAKLGVVAPEKITRECVIVNGSEVYPLVPGEM